MANYFFVQWIVNFLDLYWFPILFITGESYNTNETLSSSSSRNQIELITVVISGAGGNNRGEPYEAATSVDMYRSPKVEQDGE